MTRKAVLKTCLLLTGSNTVFNLRNFTKDNIQKIEKNWRAIKDAIVLAADLLKKFDYGDNKLSSAYILSSIACFIFKSKIKKIADLKSDEAEIRKFTIRAQIKSWFTTSLDAKLSVIHNAIPDTYLNNFKEINKQLASHKSDPLKISDTDDEINGILNFHYDQSPILPVLQLLYPHYKYEEVNFHIDHIYPKSKFRDLNLQSLTKDKNSEFYKDNNRAIPNYLYNLQLLKGSENNTKRDKDPEVWLQEHFNGDEKKIAKYKEENFIDPDFKLDWDKIEDFKKMREANIRKRLKEIIESGEI
jgi:hypothetical protein